MKLAEEMKQLSLERKKHFFDSFLTKTTEEIKLLASCGASFTSADLTSHLSFKQEAIDYFKAHGFKVKIYKSEYNDISYEHLHISWA